MQAPTSEQIRSYLKHQARPLFPGQIECLHDQGRYSLFRYEEGVRKLIGTFVFPLGARWPQVVLARQVIRKAAEELKRAEPPFELQTVEDPEAVPGIPQIPDEEVEADAESLVADIADFEEPDGEE